jgi:YesN/AraC family two-component response regulator
LVLADLRLPDMSGLDILQSVRDAGLDVPFVIITAFPSVDSAITAFKLHADDYVKKPIDDADLVNIVLRTSPREANGREQQTDEAAIDSRVVETLRLIGVQYMKSDFGLRFVADRLNISTAYLCRLMKLHTGHTFSFYLHNARIEEARRLLQQTNLEIKEIAYRTGYMTTSRLDRFFKRLCGALPGEFRRSNR